MPDVEAFLASVSDPGRRADAHALCELMAEITGEPPAMWGAGIVGFGTYHYRYASGHRGDDALASFSPRKAASVVYLAPEVHSPEAFARLGPVKTGKGCVYIKRLADVDTEVLRDLVQRSVTIRQEADRASRAGQG